MLGNASEGRRGYGMLKSERTAQQSVSKGTPRRVSVELGVTPTQGLPACLLIAGKNLGAVLDSEAGERRSRVCQPFRSVTRELAQTDRYEPSCIERNPG